MKDMYGIQIVCSKKEKAGMLPIGMMPGMKLGIKLERPNTNRKRGIYYDTL